MDGVLIMYVDSYLEMFTTLFGWMFYNNMWYVLKDTGLLLLPFIGIILDHLINYKNGVEAGDAEDLATKGVISELLIACFIIMMCGVPYMNFEATEVTFTPSAMDSSFEDSSYYVNSLESTFGVEQSFDTYPLSVNVPLFWWGVHNLSIGVTHSFMSGMPTTIDLRNYIESLKGVTIENPQLRQELSDFKRDCYIKALSQYEHDKPYESGPYVTEVNNILTLLGKEDPYWFGSSIFLTVNGYYDSFRSKTEINGFPFTAVRDQEWDVSDPNLPVNGRPFCDHWWGDTTVGLRDRIIEENSWIQTIMTSVESAFTFEERDDMLVKVALFQSVSTYAPRGYDFAYTNVGLDDGFFTRNAKRGASQLFAGAAVIKERMTNAIDITMLLNVAPILQALLLMLVVVFIPFVLFLSKYSISAVLAVAWALFSFRFLTACWMLAWWLDQNIIAALYPNSGGITTGALLAPDAMRSSQDLLYLLSYLYIIIPLIFTIVTGWAGYNVIRGLGASTMMGGLSSAGGKALSATANQAKSLAMKSAKK